MHKKCNKAKLFLLVVSNNIFILFAMSKIKEFARLNHQKIVLVANEQNGFQSEHLRPSAP